MRGLSDFGVHCDTLHSEKLEIAKAEEEDFFLIHKCERKDVFGDPIEMSEMSAYQDNNT